MKRLADMLQTLDVKNIYNEEYYNLNALKERLKGLENEFIEVKNWLMLPFYISEGLRYEIYEYELNIAVKRELNFEEYLLKLTGAKSLEDIPGDIVELRKKCYIECEENAQMIKVESLINYIDFILCNENIKNKVEKMFQSFCIDNLFFAIYG